MIPTVRTTSRLLAKMDSGQSDYRFMFVKDGVGNVTNKKCLARFEVNLPPGKYEIDALGTCRQVFDDNLVAHCPIDPELVRPPFESMPPRCVITQADLFSFLPILQAAKERQETMYIEKKGMGPKRTGEIYLDYPFNVADIVEVDADYLHMAFTDLLRYPSIELYQEAENKPLVLGYGWRNCWLIAPIADQYRHYYNDRD